MYLPKHFEVTDKEEIFAFIAAHAFAQLISSVDGRPFSTHLPFLLSDDKTKLIGHLAKPNPQHRTIENQEVLVTFQGAHDYISPSWFTTPGVPTWNYQAVHIYGTCEVISDHEKIAATVNALTNKHESVFEKRWQPKYKTAMLGAIVGLEINIEEIQGKYKISQNRPEPDQAGIMQNLETLGSQSLVSEMRRNKKMHRVAYQMSSKE